MSRQSVVFCAAAALLAACGSSQQTSTLAPMGGGEKVTVLAPVLKSLSIIHPNRGKSWVSRDAKDAPRLLFVSDFGADDVDILKMPSMTLKGTLTGFDFPEGECADTAGNIWIANAGASEMLQYSRTGTLLKTLNDPGFYPAGCAVNKSNNDLAVTNIESTTAGTGNLTIFANASGSGTAYTNSSIAQYFFVGYDPSGNLYFDGTDATRGTSYFAELPAGSSSTKLITLSGATLHFAGMIQWYNTGGYLALGDQECGGTPSACIYWITVSGSTGSNLGTTALSNSEGGAVCSMAQGVIAANGERYVAGSDYEGICGYTATTSYRWPYELGGTPTNYNNTAGLVEPLGAAVSTK